MSKSIFTALAMATITSNAAMGAPVAVLPPEGTNLAAEEAEAVGVLLANAYAEISGQGVITPKRVRASTSYHPEASASKVAQSLGVDEYIETVVVALRRTMLIRVVRRHSDGSRIHAAEMMADSLDDVEYVVQRLATALHQMVSPEDTLTHRNVTRKESRERNRIFSEKVIGLKSGATATLARGLKLEPMASLMFDLRLESDRYFLEFAAGAMVPANTHEDYVGYGALVAELGAYYIFSDSSVAPYVGGGISPRIVVAERLATTVGFVPFLDVGLTLPRESSTRFFLDLRVGQNVLPFRREEYRWEPEAGYTGLRESNDKRYFPTEISLIAGVGW